MARRRTAPKRALLLRGLDRLPIRWRLAVVSATLTGVILFVFAVGVGVFTTHRIEGDFDTQTAARFDSLSTQLDLRAGGPSVVTLQPLNIEPATTVAVWARNGQRYVALNQAARDGTIGGPTSSRTRMGDVRVSERRFNLPLRNSAGQIDRSPVISLRPGTTGDSSLGGQALQVTLPGYVQTVPVVVRLGRSYDAIERTTRRVWAALALGVIAGSVLALVAGLALGARAMGPVRRMTYTARHIARTRDLDAKMPKSRVHDEIAELGGTLQDMLDELSAAQATVDATLQRQREFVADASHELRTPLTSVQANLELLALSTEGDDREAAESALRSARRMRRLVADLLLLARMDASRETTREPVDVDRAILEAIDELEPQIGDHEVVLDLDPVTVDGIRDELVRMVANLVGNALRHTPGGTEIRVRLRTSGAHGELVVEDDGPGIPEDLRVRIFERFVRRGGEGAGSTGIGLAIVRAAAQRHGGDVRVEATDPRTGTGARFVVTFAVLLAPDEAPPGAPAVDVGVPREEAEDAVPAASPSRRVARRIRRRLQGTVRRGPTGGGDDEERLGGAGPLDD